MPQAAPPPIPLPPDPAARLAAAEALARAFAERAAEHDRAASFPHENIAALRAGAWPGLTVPARFGGAGAGLRETVAVLERLAAGDGSTALAFAMHLQTLGSAAAGEAWPAACLERVGRAAAERGALVNSCASEPELGSPSRGGLPRTRARREGAGWRIAGRKTFASLAPALDWFIVPAALDGEPETIGRFLVPAEGVRIEPNWDPMGMRATGSHDILLDEVPVPDADLLFRQSAAAPDPDRAVVNAWFTLAVSAVYLGVAACAQAAAARYARERVPSALGRPIAELESVQRRLGQAELDLGAARRCLLGVAGDWDRAEGAAARAALGGEIVAAKLFVTNAAIRVVDEAMRLAGGAAMRRDLPLERCYRDVRAGLYHPPTDDQGLALLGRLALQRVAPE